MKVKGDIKDRGNIKWTAMMLPEHIRELREWQGEDEKIERPELTDWEITAFHEEIELAYKKKCVTLVKTWEAGQIKSFQGTIEEIDIHKSTILLADPFNDERISTRDIISAQCIN